MDEIRFAVLGTGGIGRRTLVVARSGLGTLNHTALTVSALRDANVPVLGVVLNEYEGRTTAERTDPGVVAAQSDVPVAVLPPLIGCQAVVEAVADRFPDRFRGV